MAQDEIEVGETGDTLRLWLAAEAVRQAERRLADQAANLTAMETRATAILSWSATTTVALAAAASQGHIVRVAVLAGACLLAAAAFCIAALWPRGWHTSGYTFAELQSWGADNQLVIAEKTALGHEAGIVANDRRVRRFAILLRCAWTAFALAPLVSLVGAAINAL